MPVSPLGSPPLLTPPFKSAREIDWKELLSSQIVSSYQSNPNSFQNEFNCLDKLREDMCGASSLGAQTALDVLLKYYANLELLELRFSFSDKVTRSAFAWTDSFTNELSKQSSISFEKASVIYNIAVAISRLANSVPRDLKLAYKNLQISAGLFKFINDYFLHAPSFDLNQATVKFLSDLMLAQAQELLLEKMITENVISPSISSSTSSNVGPTPSSIPDFFATPSTPKEKTYKKLLCKIAAGLNSMYGALAKKISDESKFSSNLPKTFSAVITAKHLSYHALSLLLRFPMLEIETKYAEMVGSCNVAAAELKEASKISAKILSKQSTVETKGGFLALPGSLASFVNSIKSFNAMASDIASFVNKSNDVLYFVTPLSRSSLPALETHIVPEPLGFDSILPGGQKELNDLAVDIFKALVPVSVHEVSSIYSCKKDDILRVMKELVASLESEIDCALLAKGVATIASSISSSKAATETKLSSQIADLELKFDIGAYGDINSCGGRGLFFTLRQIADQSIKIGESIKSSILIEDEKCLALRKSNCVAAEFPLCSKFDDNFIITEKILTQITNRVSVDCASASKLMDIETGRFVVPGFSPSPDTAKSSGPAYCAPNLLDLDPKECISFDNLVEKVKELKLKLLDYIQIAHTISKDLEIEIRKDDINNVLVLNAKLNIDEHIMNAELAKFDVFKEKFDTLCKESRLTISDLEASWAKISQSPEYQSDVNLRTKADSFEGEIKIFVVSIENLKNQLSSSVDVLSSLQEELIKLQSRTTSLIQRYQEKLSENWRSSSISQAQRDGEILRKQIAHLSFSSGTDSSPYAIAPSAGYQSAQAPSSHPAYGPPYSQTTSQPYQQAPTISDDYSRASGTQYYQQLQQAPPQLPTKNASAQNVQYGAPNQDPAYSHPYGLQVSQKGYSRTHSSQQPNDITANPPPQQDYRYGSYPNQSSAQLAGRQYAAQNMQPQGPQGGPPALQGYYPQQGSQAPPGYYGQSAPSALGPGNQYPSAPSPPGPGHQYPGGPLPPNYPYHQPYN